MLAASNRKQECLRYDACGRRSQHNPATRPRRPMLEILALHSESR